MIIDGLNWVKDLFSVLNRIDTAENALRVKELVEKRIKALERIENQASFPKDIEVTSKHFANMAADQRLQLAAGLSETSPYCCPDTPLGKDKVAEEYMADRCQDDEVQDELKKIQEEFENRQPKEVILLAGDPEEFTKRMRDRGITNFKIEQQVL